MFQLPVCPYCHTVYHYKEVRKTKNEKQHKCYHCRETFKIKKFPGTAVLWMIVITAAVLVNVAILMIMPVFNIIPLVIVSVLAVILGLIFVPYFTAYKK